MNPLPPAVLRRLERLRIAPRHRRSNRAIGSHLSGRGGSSMEFADYRDYSPGDDTNSPQVSAGRQLGAANTCRKISRPLSLSRL